MRTLAPKLYNWSAAPAPLSWLIGYNGYSSIMTKAGELVKVPRVCSCESEPWGFFSDTAGHVINDVLHCKIVDVRGADASFLRFRSGGYEFLPSGESAIVSHGSYRWTYVRWFHKLLYGLVFNDVKLKYPVVARYSVGWCFTSNQSNSRDPETGQYYHYLSDNSSERPLITVSEEIFLPNTKNLSYYMSSESSGVYVIGENTSTTNFIGSRILRTGAFPSDILPWGKHYPSRDDMLADIRPILDTIIDGLFHFDGPISFSYHSQSGFRYSQVGDGVYLPESPLNIFLFNEVDIRIHHLIYVGKNGYWYNWLIQHAYLAACQSVPTLNDNSISNLIEIVGFIKALVVDHKIEFPKRLQDVWLQYRYVYKTSELDIAEAIKFAKRYMSLGSLNRELKCYGQASTLVDGTEVACRCTFSIRPREMGYVAKMWNALQTYGLTPDFYVVWDMIPYSFIVDWFIPVGDMLGVLDASSVFRPGERYDILNVCFSLSYEVETPRYTYKCYSRWASDPLSAFNEFYWLDKPKTSDKVLFYRILDTISLVIE